MMVLAVVIILLIEVLIWYKYDQYDTFIDSLDNPDNALDSDKNMLQFYKVMTYIWGIFCIILILILIALRKKIWIAATLYMEASKAMFSTPSMLIAPLVHWVCTTALLCAWAFVGIQLTTTDTAELQTESSYGLGHAKYNEQS